MIPHIPSTVPTHIPTRIACQPVVSKYLPERGSHSQPRSVANDAGPYTPHRARQTRVAPNKTDNLKCSSGIRPAARRCILAPAKSEGRNFMEDRIDYFERMLADNPDNPTGLLALANEYEKAGRAEDEARAAYEKGIAQSEKHGHRGMADDLRLALIQLNE